MKKTIKILMACVLVICQTYILDPVWGITNSFPDPYHFLQDTPELYEADYLYHDVLYDVYFLDIPDNLEGFLDEWEKALQENGFVVCRDQKYDEREHVMFFIGPAGTGMLFTDYDGEMLLMVPCEFNYSPQMPTPAPVQPPGPGSNGHIEEVEIDCPFCVGGVCDLCHGTGTYHLYGQSRDCPRECSSCDGRGTITQKQWVAD